MKPHWCALCGKTFKWFKDLKCHQKIHASVGDFTRASYLKQHRHIDTGEPPDKGSECEAEVQILPALETLKAHESSEPTEEKMYPRPSCGMNNTTSIYLLAHKKKHCPK